MSGKEILVVEDDQEVRDVILMQLDEEGYAFHEAEDGGKAIEILRSPKAKNLALILCDINMPHVNGIECIEVIRKEAPEIPVVVVTGYPATKLADHLFEQGIKDYLVKPVKKQLLKEVIRKNIL